LYGRHKEALDLLAIGKAQEAILILLDLAEADPNNSLVCIDIGRTVLKLGMNDQAIVAARQAIELDSTSVEAFLLLAHALEAKGEYKGANVALARAVEILRSPFRSEDDLLKADAAAPKPLVIVDQGAIFISFVIEGDISRMSIKAVSPYKNSAYILRITISGEPRTEVDDGYEVAANGELPRERLLQSLPSDIINAVKIFPAEVFGYTIFSKIKS
jgi:tetratricopeptide (TPR) repeat protein